MTNLHKSADVIAHNETALQTLVRTITLSQGQFSLVLLRCNYGCLCDIHGQNFVVSLTQRLHKISSVNIHQITLPTTVSTLYTFIRNQLGEEQPLALIVSGLELVKDLDKVLTSTNQVREEFRKKFPFPILIWVNDQVVKKLVRLAPDFNSWTTIVEFLISTEDLIQFIQQKTNEIFIEQTIPNLEICLQLEAAFQDLRNRGHILESDIQARFEFIRGLNCYLQNKLDSAVEHYTLSLEIWQSLDNLEYQGKLLFYLAQVYGRQAEQNQLDNHQYWQQMKNSLQECLDKFEKAYRPTLIAKYSNKLCEVLRILKQWDELEIFAQKALKIHQQYGNFYQQANDYSFLAEAALEKSHSDSAISYSQEALKLLGIVQNSNQYRSFPRFTLARARRKLLQSQEALIHLEKARDENNPQHSPQLHISILKELHSLYFEREDYIKAFRTKQEQRSIEQQYGFRAFIGAGSLNPHKQSINSTFLQTEEKYLFNQKVTVPGREQDVKRLLRRISSTEHKLTIIYGQSGVGKSSILNAGLIPALRQQLIGERDALPVLLKVYTNWVESLERGLNDAYTQVKKIFLPSTPNSIINILEKLRENSSANLLTVLIFDQFEEFFFECKDQSSRSDFYQFFGECINIPYVKVILSLRQDYIHELLDFTRLRKLNIINNNILDKDILYYVGNFSVEDTKSVIESLTKYSSFNLEPDLIDQLVTELALDVGEVSPIELQIVGAQLQEEKITTLKHYKALGSKPKIILVERYLQQVILDCGSEENKKSAELVLFLLTDENRMRPIKSFNDLYNALGLQANDLNLVLEVLVGSGLVFTVRESPVERYQLVHDYLVGYIRSKKQGYVDLLEQLAHEQKQRIISEKKLNVVYKWGLFIAIGLVTVLVLLYLKSESSSRELKTTIGKLEKINSELRQEKQKTQSLQKGLIETSSKYSQELLVSGKQDEGLVTGLQAGKLLQQAKKEKDENVDKASFMRVSSTIEQFVYRQRRQPLKKHKDAVTYLAFSPDGKSLASVSADKSIVIWDISNDKYKAIKNDLGQVHSDEVKSVIFSPDGKMLASASKDKSIKIWNIDGKQFNQIRTIYNAHNDVVTSISFSSDSKTIASASWDKSIKLWDMKNEEPQSSTINDSPVISIQINPKEPNQIAFGSLNGKVKIWDGKQKNEPFILGNHSVRVASISFSSDGKYLASGSFDNTIKLWDSDKIKELHTFKGHKGPVTSISFSPDGNTLASASGDGSIKLWNLDKKEEVATLRGHSGILLSVTFNKDGNQLASASTNKTIMLWNLDLNDLINKGCKSLESISKKKNSNINQTHQSLCEKKDYRLSHPSRWVW